MFLTINVADGYDQTDILPIKEPTFLIDIQLFQEVIYKEHGKHPKEAMFFLHALPLPGNQAF